MSDTTINGHNQSVEDREAQQRVKDAGELPTHIAFIMDGNGRWARRRGKQRVVGHHEGVESVRDIVEACAQLGIGYTTLYTFSTENWQRPDAEVDALMHLLVHTIREEKQTLMDNDIRLKVMGDVAQVPERCRNQLSEAIEATRNNQRMTLVMALSYSGHWEITRACQKIARRVKAGQLRPEDIDEDAVAAEMCLPEVPHPDLLVRTSGEHRLSNFLLWQLAYTEIHVTDCLWPDFRRENLYDAIREYQQRERRYGRVMPPEEAT